MTTASERMTATILHAQQLQPVHVPLASLTVRLLGIAHHRNCLKLGSTIWIVALAVVACSRMVQVRQRRRNAGSNNQRQPKMRSHPSSLIPRMIRAGLKVHACRYRVTAAGIDNRGRIISLCTNQPYLPSQGRHAEERVIYSSPRSLVKIILFRVAKDGRLLPIHPCERCNRLATKRGITIKPINVVEEAF